MIVNPQIRRVGIAVTACSWPCSCSSTTCRSSRPTGRQPSPQLRAVLRDYSHPRGDIVDARRRGGGHLGEGRRRVRAAATYTRRRPVRPRQRLPLLHLGATGVEDAYNDDLAGRRADQAVKNIGDWLIGKEPTGDVVLTITNAAQEAARAALGDRRGSVVALDPTTGAVLALWSNPSYDPSPLAGHSAKAVQAAFDAYKDDPANPMLARAYRERYPRGPRSRW